MGDSRKYGLEKEQEEKEKRKEEQSKEYNMGDAHGLIDDEHYWRNRDPSPWGRRPKQADIDALEIREMIPSTRTNNKFKFDEDRFMGEALDYIASTYGQHYVGEDKEKTQVVDLWESLGSLDTTSRDTAIKYLSRYGKKGGYNKKDLMKAIHYTILLWYATEAKQ